MVFCKEYTLIMYPKSALDKEQSGSEESDTSESEEDLSDIEDVPKTDF